MRHVITRLVLTTIGLMPLRIGAQPPRTPVTPVHVDRFGVYLVAEDVERSARFYQAVFGTAPEVRMPSLVGFDIGGAFLAIIARATYAPGVRRGDNAVPYIKVRDVAAVHAHVRAIAPASLLTPEVIVEGPFRFFKLQDPDRNVLKFYSVTRAP